MKISQRVSLPIALAFVAGAVTDRFIVGDVSVAHAQAQRSSVLIIGSETVSVGMARDTAIAKFAGKYELLPAGGGSESLMILEKRPSGATIGEFLGLLNFVRGTVVEAERSWGAFYSKDGIDGLWTSLDGALSQELGLNNWSTVQIRRTQVETPKVGVRTIDIRFPERTIQLEKSRSERVSAGALAAHPETYSVSEIVPFPLQ